MLIIRDAQLEVLRHARHAAFAARVEAHLRSSFPAHAGSLPAAQLHGVVLALLRTGAGYGFSTERDLLLFCTLAAADQLLFVLAKVPAWTHRVLSDAEVFSPSERLNRCAAEYGYRLRMAATALAGTPRRMTTPPQTDQGVASANQQDPDQLDRSVALAQQAPAHVPADPVSACPLRQRHVLEAVLLDEAGEPVYDVLVLLLRAPGYGLQTRTDVHGRARFDGVPPGSYQLTLPRLDTEAWQLVSQQGLPDKGQGDAAWARVTPPSTEGQLHTVVSGDCIASLAFGQGLLPQTVWDDARNQHLHQANRSMYLLISGDVVYLPAPRQKMISVTVDTRYTLRRNAVPELLDIRLVDFQQNGRAGLPYRLTVETGEGVPVPARSGVTDAAGLLREPIPPSALRATLVLQDEEGEEEVLELELGELNPLEDLRGVQGRLRALQFPCPLNGELDEQTQNALAAFQATWGLTVTRTADDATRGKLEELFGS